MTKKYSPTWHARWVLVKNHGLRFICFQAIIGLYSLLVGATFFFLLFMENVIYLKCGFYISIRISR